MRAAPAASFLSNEHLHFPLRPPFSQGCKLIQVLCFSHTAVEVCRAASRLQKHPVAPTDAKSLYRLRKKEAWKTRRRERKEKEKLERVTDPVWYEFLEKDVLIEREKLRTLDVRDDDADDFLYDMKEQRLAERIVLDGNDTVIPVPFNKKTSRVRITCDAAHRPNVVPESLVAISNKNSKDPVIEVLKDAVVENGHRNLLCGDLNPKKNSKGVADSERKKKLSVSPGKYRISKKTALRSEPSWTIASYNGRQPGSTIQAADGNDIESFSDDEVPKVTDVWKKGVGIVKSRKFLISKEEKEKIEARRRGDLSVLGESTEDDDVYSETASLFHFDGRAALLEDKKIQKLAARLNKINYWTSKYQFSKVMHSGKMKLTEDRVLRIVEILGDWGNWRRAMQVVQWVHKRQQYQFHKSKFIFTTLLSVLGQAKRHVEALNVFSVMRVTLSLSLSLAFFS